MNASRSDVHRDLLLPVGKLALQDDTKHAEAVWDIPQERILFFKFERYVLVPHIQEQIHHERVSEIVMEQIVGVTVSLQLNDEIVLIRRVYEERNLDKCADVPALLMRCAGPERLTYVWVPGSIKSIPMFLWRACSFAPQNT